MQVKIINLGARQMKRRDFLSKTAIGAAKAQIIYKKLTGSPETIAFFEETN